MGLGMKHELDHEQYKAILKEVRKISDKLDIWVDLMFIVAASQNSSDPDEIVKNAIYLKKAYLNSKYGTEAFKIQNEDKKGE